MNTPDGPPVAQNHLLAALPVQEYQSIAPDLEKITLRVGDLLLEQNAPIQFVYFPEIGVISLVECLEGKKVEVIMIGNEGMVGIPILLHDEISCLEAVSQVPGQALRMSIRTFQSLVEQNPSFRYFLERFTGMMLNEISLCLACRQLHSTEQQMERWLLMCHDRLHEEEFPFTQGFLSDMLCVRRATVTTLAKKLKQAGLIDYRRGRIRIVNRAKLEQATCACYGLVKEEYARLLESFARLRLA